MMQIGGHGIFGNLEERRFNIPKTFRQDIQPKNYMRENLKRLRRIQQLNKAREMESQKPVKALWHSDRYKNIQSKVKAELQKPPPTSRPASANFLRSHSHSSSPVPEKFDLSIDQNCGSFYDNAPASPSIPKARNNIDFVKWNGREASRPNLKKSSSLTALDKLQNFDPQTSANYQTGVVPKYIKERKEKWRVEEEERIANTPDPSMPHGHRAMPDEERRNTLQILQRNQKTLMDDLQSLPLTSDTLRVRQKKQDIERKLAELDEAIQIFSRPKVFVKIDN